MLADITATGSGVVVIATRRGARASCRRSFSARRQGDGVGVGIERRSDAAGAGEQVGASGRQEVVAVELRVVAHPAERRQAGEWTVAHPHRDRPVEGDDR